MDELNNLYEAIEDLVVHGKISKAEATRLNRLAEKVSDEGRHFGFEDAQYESGAWED